MVRRLFIVILLLGLASCSTSKVIITPPEAMNKERVVKGVNVALVLGGGGSRGIAHIGVIAALEKHGIPIDMIVGTSVGSIVGALYSNYKDSDLLYKTLVRLKKWDILDLSIHHSLQFFIDLKAPFQGYNLENFMVKNLTVNNLEDLNIPLVVVASDVQTEQSYRISAGPIATAVHASSAIPPFFSPVKAYGRLLVDGGVTEPVPVDTAKTYSPKLTIAVDISTPGKEYSALTMYDVTMRSMYISYYVLSQMQSKRADVLIHPNCYGFGFFDDENNEVLFKKGWDAAIAAMPKIKLLLKQNRIPLRFNTN